MKFINSRGKTWYLHKKKTIIGRNKLPTVTYFFRQEKKEDYVTELPFGYMVKETHPGLPVVKKI